ncbi:hypothetical protein [Paenirhodobacter enshiensis]|uniref:hypothetical protein n=1 Tax=Paenirhodobacter enshiensis TaxID=1105367 RepID=UPI0035B1EB32
MPNDEPDELANLRNETARLNRRIDSLSMILCAHMVATKDGAGSGLDGVIDLLTQLSASDPAIDGRGILDEFRKIADRLG